MFHRTFEEEFDFDQVLLYGCTIFFYMAGFFVGGIFWYEKTGGTIILACSLLQKHMGIFRKIMLEELLNGSLM